MAHLSSHYSTKGVRREGCRRGQPGEARRNQERPGEAQERPRGGQEREAQDTRRCQRRHLGSWAGHNSPKGCLKEKNAQIIEFVCRNERDRPLYAHETEARVRILCENCCKRCGPERCDCVHTLHEALGVTARTPLIVNTVWGQFGDDVLFKTKSDD